MSSDSSSLSADISLIHDPYEMALRQEKFQKNLIPFDNSSKFARKVTKFKNMMMNAKNNALQGAMMGFMIGGLFGFTIGCYSAIQTRRFMAIPISTLISGCSFGFILGCGSAIRNDEVADYPNGQLAEGEWINVYRFNADQKL